jgi:hypothetical protein
MDLKDMDLKDMDRNSEEMTPEEQKLLLIALKQIPSIARMLPENPVPVVLPNYDIPSTPDKRVPFWYDFAEMLREEMKGPCGPLG